MKRILTLLSALFSSFLLLAQTVAEIDTYSDAQLDSIKIEKQFLINDYSMVGVQYGQELLNTFFNPVRDTRWRYQPHSFGVFWTRYAKMFGLYPYFGLQVGVLYGHQGFAFRENPETHAVGTLDGMTGAVLETVELPVLMQMHLDAGPVKFLFDGGVYGAYRLSIERFGDAVAEQWVHTFKDTDYRWDYGLKGGVGIGYMFDRFEIHLKGTFRWSLQGYYQPDYYSQYYYRFSNPYDVNISAGLHFLLEKRRGKTRRELRREAWKSVYEPEEKPEEP